MTIETTGADIAENASLGAHVETETALKNTTQQEVVAEVKSNKTEEDAPFPKKAVHALSRRDKKIGQLQAEITALRMAQQQREVTKTTQPETDGPKEDDFENYGDYLKATARYAAKQELEESRKQAQEKNLSAKEAEYLQSREAHVERLAVKHMESFADFAELAQTNADIMDSLPKTVERAFLEADDGALAFYILAKEGALDGMVTMTGAQAANVIAKAELRGEALLKQPKPFTKAPAPIAGNNGVGISSKPLNKMSWDEMKKELNIR